MMISVCSEDIVKKMCGQQLRLGDWKEIATKSNFNSTISHFSAPKDAAQLYSVALNISKSLNFRSSVIFQADNSTFPSEDEVGVFAELMGKEIADDWAKAQSRCILFFCESDVDIDSCANKIMLLILFSSIFEWHVYFVPDMEDDALVSVRDGVISLYGDALNLRYKKESSSEI